VHDVAAWKADLEVELRDVTPREAAQLNHLSALSGLEARGVRERCATIRKQESDDALLAALPTPDTTTTACTVATNVPRASPRSAIVDSALNRPDAWIASRGVDNVPVLGSTFAPSTNDRSRWPMSPALAESVIQHTPGKMEGLVSSFRATISRVATGAGIGFPEQVNYLTQCGPVCRQDDAYSSFANNIRAALSRFSKAVCTKPVDFIAGDFILAFEVCGSELAPTRSNIVFAYWPLATGRCAHLDPKMVFMVARAVNPSSYDIGRYDSGLLLELVRMPTVLSRCQLAVIPGGGPP
jgi:hypothetical protein